MLADFQNSVTVVFAKKFATKPLPHFLRAGADHPLTP